MKKLLTFALLIVATVFNAQEFQKVYSELYLKKSTDKEFVQYKSESRIFFNYGGKHIVKMFVNNQEFVYKVTTTPEKKYDSKGKEYQQGQMVDMDNNLYYLNIFTDENFGCLIIANSYAVGFR